MNDMPGADSTMKTSSTDNTEITTASGPNGGNPRDVSKNVRKVQFDWTTATADGDSN
jgi:hypothetical protein